MMNNKDLMLHEAYESQGYCIIRRFTSRVDTIDIYSAIYRYSLRQKNPNSILCYPPRLLAFFDFRLYRNNGFSLKGIQAALALLRATSSPQMSKIKKSLGLKRCSRVDSYFSSVGTEEIIGWHCDQSFGGAPDPGIYFNGNKGLVSISPINKFFHYLTEVSTDNGALCYIPGSHLIGTAIRIAINDGLIDYRPFMDIRDAIDIANNHCDALTSTGKVTHEDIHLFLRHTDKAMSQPSIYALSANAGDLVIFNDLGYHMGSAPRRSRRLVARYFF